MTVARKLDEILFHKKNRISHLEKLVLYKLEYFVCAHAVSNLS